MCDSSALGCMLALCFDGQGGAAKNVQAAFLLGLLIEFAHFGRGRDRVEHASVGDPGFCMIGDELIAVGGNPYSWVTRCCGHGFLRDYLPH